MDTELSDKIFEKMNGIFTELTRTVGMIFFDFDGIFTTRKIEISSTIVIPPIDSSILTNPKFMKILVETLIKNHIRVGIVSFNYYEIIKQYMNFIFSSQQKFFSGVNIITPRSLGLSSENWNGDNKNILLSFAIKRLIPDPNRKVVYFSGEEPRINAKFSDRSLEDFVELLDSQISFGHRLIEISRSQESDSYDLTPFNRVDYLKNIRLYPRKNQKWDLHKAYPITNDQIIPEIVNSHYISVSQFIQDSNLGTSDWIYPVAIIKSHSHRCYYFVTSEPDMGITDISLYYGGTVGERIPNSYKQLIRYNIWTLSDIQTYLKQYLNQKEIAEIHWIISRKEIESLINSFDLLFPEANISINSLEIKE